MNILFVGDNPIFGFVGGNAENIKYYVALKKFAVDNGHLLKVLTRDKDLDELLEIKTEKNKKTDIISRLKGHSSFLYLIWKQNIDIIKQYKPDLVVIGRSRLGFVAKSVKKNLPNCKVITNIDNVEFDFVDSYFSNTKGLKGIILKKIEKFLVKRDEADAIKFSDTLIYLTSRNVQRISDVYGHSELNPYIVPICLDKSIELRNIERNKTVFFVGSLDYQANVLAVEELLDLWKVHYADNDKIQLIIAGRNPSNVIVENCNLINNVRIIPNFDNIVDIIPKYSMMIAPIQKGAGMKVKVAEALSMGVMVAASDEALVGYENSINEDMYSAIMRCNSSDEYREAIDKYLKTAEDELKMIEKQNKVLFESYYSIKYSNEKIGNILKTITI